MESQSPDTTLKDSEDIKNSQHDVPQAKAAFRTRLSRFAYANGTAKNEKSTSGNAKATQARRDAIQTRIAFSPAAAGATATKVRKTANKRAASGIAANGVVSPAKQSSPNKKRTSAKERSAGDPVNPPNKLVDSLRPGLILVFIGLNPGLETARSGHAYAHRSNLFWRLLYESGVTPEQRLPSETHALPDLYSIGNTNICARPTRDGSGLSKAELAEGAGILEEKVREFKPEAVAIVGKGIWEALWLARTGKKMTKQEFKYGWQDAKCWLGRTKDQEGKVHWPGAKTFVTTTTSGLAAGMKPHEKLAIWKPLGEWFTARRKELDDAATTTTETG